MEYVRIADLTSCFYRFKSALRYLPQVTAGPVSTKKRRLNNNNRSLNPLVFHTPWFCYYPRSVLSQCKPDPLTLGSHDGHIHQPLHFRKDQSQAPQWMLDTNDKIKAANAFVIVTPEYNCSLPPALTSMLDNFPPASYRHKPCGIVSYSMGSFGGIRAASFARPFLSELGMISTPSVCTIPQVPGKFDGESCTDERIKKNLDKVVAEIVWYGKAISSMKDQAGVPS